jgi:hypothetical protein
MKQRLTKRELAHQRRRAHPPSDPNNKGNKVKTALLAIALLKLSCFAQAPTPPPASAPPGVNDSMDGPIFADLESGSDCGAKINAALRALGVNPGNIEFTPACGSITTAVVLGRNQHLYPRPGTYTVSAVISLKGNNSSIQCDPTSDAPAANYGTCYFREAGAANIAEVFLLNGTDVSLVNVTVDGNASLNTDSGPNIVVTGLRARLSYINSTNSHTYGVKIGNGSANAAAATKLEHVMILANGSDGLNCAYTSDLSIGAQSEIENNGGNGITLANCGGARVTYNDVSGNALDGISIRGTATGTVSAYNALISNNFFSQQGQNDVEIQGWDSDSSAYSSLNNIVNDNIFQGSSMHSVGDAWDAIRIQDSGYNSINGNVIQDQFGKAYQYLTGIDLVSEHGELGDSVVGNNVQTTGIPYKYLINTAMAGNSANGTATPPTQGSSFRSTGTRFKASGCGVTSATGGASAGYMVLTSGGPCTLVVTPGDPPLGATGWNCKTNDITTPANLLPQVALSSTTATFKGLVAADDVVTFSCDPF